MTLIKKKPSNWICKCGRKNDPTAEVCGFCQTEKPEDKKPSKLKHTTAYDELHLWPVFSSYIRLRDSDSSGTGRCITCGRFVHWRRADAGHGVPRQYQATKYNELNVHLQCKPCNGFQGGARERYKEEMDKRYGAGTWDKMMVASRMSYKKLGEAEIDVLVLYYEREVERLLATKKTPS